MRHKLAKEGKNVQEGTWSNAEEDAKVRTSRHQHPKGRIATSCILHNCCLVVAYVL